MINLKEINYEEFKKDVYKHYKKLFPKDERKPLSMLQKLFKTDNLKFVKIMDNHINVGFLIYVTMIDNPYIWLDYFAIYKDFQNKNYGTKAIKIFKNFLNSYAGIYGEIEKVGYGITKEEDSIREKRWKFWSNLGFELLNIDINLFGVIYSPCVLKLTDLTKDNKEILDYGFKLYEVVTGRKELKKNCFIMQ